MARSLCTCGRVLLWKADEPESDEWHMIAVPDYPEEESLGAVWQASSSAVFCPGCGRLWVHWDTEDAEAAESEQGFPLTEYVPVEPDARPVRRGRNESSRRPGERPE